MFYIIIYFKKNIRKMIRSELHLTGGGMVVFGCLQLHGCDATPGICEVLRASGEAESSELVFVLGFFLVNKAFYPPLQSFSPPFVFTPLGIFFCSQSFLGTSPLQHLKK